MAGKKAENGAEIYIAQVDTKTIVIKVLGRTPLILNRMSQKSKRDLLMPKGRKTAADKASTLKHDPIQEFQAAAHRLPDGPTLLAIPGGAFKGALRTSALDIPGAKKAQIGRLTWVEGEYVPVYGVPKLLMSVTRSADMARTPDIRTRVIVPKWAATFAVTFMSPILKDVAIMNLAAAAGVLGVGDWRLEKGSGNYGQFQPVGADRMKEWNEVVKEGGRAAQIEAMDKPEAYDDETAELLSWFGIEIRRRGFTVVKEA